MEGFYDPLISLCDRAVTEQFLQPESHTLLLEEQDLVRWLDLLTDYRVPSLDRWSSQDKI